MHTHIPPTVGRVVWYRPEPSDPVGFETLAAHVARVNDDGTVNLMVITGTGHTFGKTNVPLVQDGETAKSPWGYCEWMPYQKGQAAKHDAAAKGGAA